MNSLKRSFLTSFFAVIFLCLFATILLVFDIFFIITQSIFPFKLQVGDYNNEINISNTNNIFAKRQNNNMAKKDVRKDLFKKFIH